MDRLIFNILNRVDSSNNYAMQRVHEGLAIHGEAWFARMQTAGKGQRGKTWESEPDENLLMSVVIRPPDCLTSHPFYLSAMVSVVCSRFISEIAYMPCRIKWPNDLYFNDRKAGGILIENNIRGNSWRWSVIGIGINVNQSGFGNGAGNPVSLFQLTGKRNNAADLAKMLHKTLIQAVDNVSIETKADYLSAYNDMLFRREEKVWLKKGSDVFEAQIKGVNERGDLMVCRPEMCRYAHGEIAWIL